VIAVAHHQPATVLVALIGELLDIGGDFGLQCGGQYLPGTVSDDLTQQRSPAGLIGIVNYGEHGRTFPTSAPTPVLIRATSTFRSSSGRCAHLHAPSLRLIHKF
jgi:hypothetical protein